MDNVLALKFIVQRMLKGEFLKRTDEGFDMPKSGSRLLAAGDVLGGAHFGGDRGRHLFHALLVDLCQRLDMANTNVMRRRTPTRESLFGCATAVFTSASLPSEIIAKGVSLAGLMTSKSLALAGATHFPSIKKSVLRSI